jgi:glycosyltransferase involved in cell wall biosynthesis
MSPASGSEPFISVVTVSLNAAATIGDTLASVARQRFELGVEHICVDGGSTDGTRALINEWAARATHIRPIYEPDTGIFDAMNKGLRAARGEYVLFLNADDFLSSADILSRVMRGLAPGLPHGPDLVVGDVAMGEPGCRGIWRRRYAPRLLQRFRGVGLYPPHQGMFAKRTLLESVGGFDARQRFAADTNLYYDLEHRFRPSIRLIAADVAFMRAGGTANAGLRAIWQGTAEIYQHLAPTRGSLKAAIMVTVKSLQSLAEVRYGTPTQPRWFAQ